MLAGLSTCFRRPLQMFSQNSIVTPLGSRNSNTRTPRSGRSHVGSVICTPSARNSVSCAATFSTCSARCRRPTSLSARELVAVPSVIIEQLQPGAARKADVRDVELTAIDGLLLFETQDAAIKIEGLIDISDVDRDVVDIANLQWNRSDNCGMQPMAPWAACRTFLHHFAGSHIG